MNEFEKKIAAIRAELLTENERSPYFDVTCAIAYLSGRLPELTIVQIHNIFGDIFRIISVKTVDHIIKLSVK